MPSATRPSRSRTSVTDRHRKVLLEERAALSEQLADSERNIALWLTGEPRQDSFDEEGGEGSSLAVELQQEEALRARLQATLDEIDAALARIDAGTYGTCESCRGEIGAGRLEALPTARQCVRCKSAGPLRRR